MSEYILSTNMTMAELEEALKNHSVIGIYEYTRDDSHEVFNRIASWLNIPAGGQYRSILFILKTLFGSQRPSSDTARKIYERWVEIKNRL